MCRGRVKSIRTFRCSGAALSGATRESAIMNIVTKGADVKEILYGSPKIAIDDIKTSLTLMVLQFTWSQYAVLYRV